MSVDSMLVSRAFSFVLKTGVEVFPVRMKRQATGRVAFRVSPGGNTVEDSKEVEEAEMIEKVLRHRFAVRCTSLDGSVKGLYVEGGHSVRELKKYSTP